MIAGVDGCREGWIVITAPAWPCQETLGISVQPDFAGVLEATADCSSVVADIPIGIPSGDSPRECDLLARKQLGRRGTAVFPVPPRRALEADSYERAKTICSELGVARPSRQLWAISDRILDADANMTPELQERVREYHPELAWKRMAGFNLASKARPAGIVQRFGLLRQAEAAGPFLSAGNPHLDSARVGIDDYLDAVVGLRVAADWLQGAAERLPQDPPRDERGLRMEILY
jgi:predicted RNase H-like nuclease